MILSAGNENRNRIPEIKALSYIVCAFIGIFYALAGNLLISLSEIPTKAENAFSFASYPISVTFLLEVLILPVLEELIFRKLLFPAFRKKLNGIISALITSVIFAILHFNLAQAIYAFFFSLTACYIVEKTKSFWASSVFHIFANAIAFTVNTVEIVRSFFSDYAICVLILAALFFIGALFLFRLLHKTEVQ